jgi:hypothetical protein
MNTIHLKIIDRIARVIVVAYVAYLLRAPAGQHIDPLPITPIIQLVEPSVKKP